VLDTWFSSALWPFATLGWPDDTPQLRAFYPTDVLSTARDILFLWVARMVMMGLEFRGDVPFSDVYVHSVIQAADGRRMSKSLGTGIDPLELIDRYGADATRFGLLAMSSTQDVRFSEEKIDQGSKLANKLFNATRFVLLNVAQDAEAAPMGGRGPDHARVEDRWILSRLQAAKADFDARVAAFDFSKAALGLYDFVYGELCDWYLELIKGREFDSGLSGHLLHVMRETLALAHPIIPFVTEELWSRGVGGPEPGLLAATKRSPADDALRDPQAEADIDSVIAAVQAVRSWRDASGVKPGDVLDARLQGLDGLAPLVCRLARLAPADDGRAPVATIPVAGVQVDLLTGVDPEEAARKVAAQRDHLRTEIARAEGKLANERFVSRAPEEVVAGERAKLDRLRSELEALDS
jgi:valyl-tRNA synthetase